MSQFLSIIISAALVNNLAIVHLLGVSSLFSFSGRFQNAVEIALLSAVVMFLSATVNLLLYKFVLEPFGLEVLRLLTFLGVTSLITIAVLQGIQQKFPLSFRRQQLTFLLVAGNSAIVGVSIIAITRLGNLLEGIAFNLGSAAGFALIVIAFAALFERLETADVPLLFRGSAIQLVSAGIAAMCLLGFAGLV